LTCKESKNHTSCFPWSKKAICLRLSARQAGQEKRGGRTDFLRFGHKKNRLKRRGGSGISVGQVWGGTPEVWDKDTVESRITH